MDYYQNIAYSKGTMRLAPLVGSIFFLVSSILFVGFAPTHFQGTKPSDPRLYPDKNLTPGLVATTNVKELTDTKGGTYSQRHRNTTQAQKNQVCKEYPTNCQGAHEIDHYCPLALGCADDVKNLWAQPEHVIVNGQDLGFHTKDKLEFFLYQQMKAGKITPADAQNCILADWVACYGKYFYSNQTNNFGSIVQIATSTPEVLINKYDDEYIADPDAL